MEAKMIEPRSKSIGVLEIRQLKEISNTLDRVLTEQEFIAIISIYNSAIARLLKESGTE